MTWRRTKRLSLVLLVTALAATVGQAQAESLAVPAPITSPLPAGLEEPRQFWRNAIETDGTLALEFNDIGIPAPIWPLALSRGYRSDQRASVGLGPGWGWSYGVSLRVDPESGQPEIIEANGSTTVYAGPHPDGTFRPRHGRLDTVLLGDADGQWHRFETNGRYELFAADGLLLERGDAAGTSQHVLYEAGELRAVETNGGRRLRFEHSDGLLAAVIDPLGRRFTFSYAGGRLVEVTDPLGRTTRYDYSDGLLSAVHTSDGSELVVTYDVEARVTEGTGPGYLGYSFTYDARPDGTRFERIATDRIGRQWRTRLERLDGNAGLRLVEENPAGEETIETMGEGLRRLQLPGGVEYSLLLDQHGAAQGLIDAAGVFRDIRNTDVGLPAFGQPARGAVLDENGMPDRILEGDEVLSVEWDMAGRPVLYRTADGREEQFFYDDGDRVTRMVDGNRQTFVFEYDAADRVTRFVDHFGAALTVDHDAAGFVVLEAPPIGPATRYGYDEAGQLVEAAAGPFRFTFNYDAAGRLAAVLDELGRETRYSYDPRGLPDSVDGPAGPSFRFQWDDRGFLQSVADGSGRQVAFRTDAGVLLVEASAEPPLSSAQERDGVTVASGSGAAASLASYDAQGRLTSYQPGGNASLFDAQFDQDGRLTAEERGGEATTYEFDAAGRVVVARDTNGAELTTTYDEAGRVTGLTSVSGEKYEATYDGFGHLIRMLDTDGGWVEWDYDSMGRQVAERRPDGTIAFVYGDDGLILREEHSDGLIVAFVHDNRERLVAVRETLVGVQRLTRYTWDDQDRLVAVDYPDGGRESIAYDEFNRVVESVVNGVSRHFSYDDADRVVRVDGDEGELDYRYGGDGRLAAFGDALELIWPEDGSPWPSGFRDVRGGTWQLSRDDHGRVQTLVDPVGGVLSLEYDAAGNAIAGVDPEGRRFEIEVDDYAREKSFGPADGPKLGIRRDPTGRPIGYIKQGGGVLAVTYDEVGRLVEESLDTDVIASYGYGGHGDPEWIEDEVGHHQFTYNEAGQLVEVTDGFGYALDYEYDRLGRPVALILPEGERLEVSYNDRGQLVRSGLVDDPVDVDYDALGRVQSLRLSNGLAIKHDYVGQQLAQLSYLAGDGQALRRHGAQWDDAGILTGIVIDGETHAVAGDPLGRLTSYGDSGFAYDGSGNLTAADGREFTYDSAWRLTEIDGAAVEHDTDGNLTSLPDGTRFAWDGLGRLISATLPDGRQIGYRYDHRRRLVERRSGDEVRRILWDEDRPLAIYDGEGNRLFYIEWLPTVAGAARIHGPEGVTAVAVDRMGSPTALISADATVEPIRWSPWGVLEDGPIAADGLIGFTGLITDPETGVVFMSARPYLPTIGRFLSPDPLGWADDINPYAYVRNAPLDWVDREGLAVTEPSIKIRFGPLGTGLRDPLFPLWPQSGGLRPVDPSSVGSAALRDLERTARRHAGTLRGRVAQETLDLVRRGHLSPSFPTTDPNGGGALGRVRHGRPLMPEVYPGEHAGRVNRLPQAARQGRLFREVATSLVHEVTHSVQHMRGQPYRPAVWEFEAYLRDSIYDPSRRGYWSQGRRTPVDSVIRQALRASLKKGIVPDAGDMRAIERIIRGYAPHLSEAKVQQNVQRAFSQFYRANKVDLRQFARQAPASRAASAAGQARAASNAARAGLARTPGITAGRVLGGVVRVGGTALAVVGAVMMTDQYWRGEIGHGEYWGSMAALAGSIIAPWPVGAAVLAHSVGSFVGGWLGEKAAALMRDPNSLAGRLLRELFEKLGWINANDPTFLAIPARLPPRLGGTGPPTISPGFPATVWEGWFGGATWVEARIVGVDGATLRTLSTASTGPGALELAWDGRDNDGAPAVDGDYTLLMRSAWRENRLVDGYPRRIPLRVDAAAPSVELAPPEMADGRFRAKATLSEPGTIVWSLVDAEGETIDVLSTGRGGSMAELDVALGEIDPAAAILSARLVDAAGNLGSAEVALGDRPAPDDLISDVAMRLRLEPAETLTDVSEADIVPSWIGGGLPDKADTDGEWLWDETVDPHGARAHVSDTEGVEAHLAFSAEGGWFLGNGDRLVQYLLIDSDRPPEQLVLQVYTEGRDGEHRVVFGSSVFDLGASSGAVTVDLGSPLARGEWLRLSVPAEELGLVGRRIEGFGFIVAGGRVLWGTTTRSGPTDTADIVALASERRRLLAEWAEIEIDVSLAQAARLESSVVVEGDVRPIEDAGVDGGSHRLRWRGPLRLLSDGAVLQLVATAGERRSEQTLPLRDLLAEARLVARIDVPTSGTIGRQTIPVFGQAGGLDFASYILDARPVGATDETPWTVIVQSNSPSLITNDAVRRRIEQALSGQLRSTVFGNLGSLDTGSFNHDFAFRPEATPWASGEIDIRLRVLGTDGTEVEDTVRIRIGEVADGAFASEVVSADGRARLRIPALGVPAGQAAMAIAAIPPPDLPEGLLAAKSAYAIGPTGMALAASAALTMLVDDDRDWSVVAVSDSGVLAELPVRDRQDGAITVRLDQAYPVVFLVTAAEAGTITVVEPDAGSDGLVVGYAAPFAHMQLIDATGAIVDEVAAAADGGFRFAAPSDAGPLSLRANTAAGTEATLGGIDPVAGIAVDTLTVENDRIVAVLSGTEASRVVVRVGDTVAVLRRDGTAYTGTFAPSTGGALVDVALAGASITVAGTWPDGGPSAPELVAAGVAPAVVMFADPVVFTGSANPSAAPEYLVPAPFDLAAAPVLNFSYRFSPDSTVALLLRRGDGVDVIDLTGNQPSEEGAIRIARPPPLLADGAWHHATLFLHELLGASAGEVDGIAVGQLIRPAWRTYRFARLGPGQTAELKSLRLGAAWPTRSPLELSLTVVSPGTTRIDWRIDDAAWQEVAASDAAVSLPLPALDEGLHVVGLRAVDSSGAIGPVAEWPLLIDETPPQIGELSPAPNLAAPDQRVAATVTDDGIGVDAASLRLTVNDVEVPRDAVAFNPANGQLDLALGDIPGLAPPELGSTVTAAITALADRAGNALVEPRAWSWRFMPEQPAVAGLRRLTDDGALDATWLPDGSGLIHVATDGGVADLFLTPLAGGAAEKITTDGAPKASPSIHVDGRRLVYESEGAIILRDLETDETRQLLEGAVGPAWFGDLLLAGRDDAVVTIDPESAAVTVVCRAPGGGSVERPRPVDETTIAFTRQLYQRSLWSCAVDSEVRAITRDLDDPALIEHDAAPVGTAGAFVFAEGGPNGGIWLQLPSGERRRLLQESADHRRLAVSPDGTLVAYDSDRDGRRNIWLLALTTGPIITVNPPVFSPGTGAAAVTVRIAEPGVLTVDVLDSAGNRIAALHPVAPVRPGDIALEWLGMTDGGVPLDDGAYSLRVAFDAGSGAVETTAAVRLDATPPLARVSRAGDGRELGPLVTLAADDSIVVTASDGAAGSGVATIEYQAPPATEWIPAIGEIAIADFPEATILLRTTDNLGQVSEPVLIALAGEQVGQAIEHRPETEPEPEPVPEPAPVPTPEPPAPQESQLDPIYLLLGALAVALAIGAVVVLLGRATRINRGRG